MPRTDGGDFARDADTFQQMAKVYPQIASLSSSTPWDNSGCSTISLLATTAETAAC